MTTIPNLIENAVKNFQDQEAVVDENLRWTFEEYGEQINSATKAFMSKGIEPGDRVAIWAPNTAEWPVAALGAHCAGAVLVPINTRFKGEEASYILSRTSAKILFTVTDFLDIDYVDLLNDVNSQLDIEEIVVLRGSTPNDCTTWEEFIASGTSIDLSLIHI